METIQIKNFRLNVFKQLLDQSLIVDNELMFEWTTEMIKSCSFATSKSFLKLWTTNLTSLVKQPDAEIESLDAPKEIKIDDFETFNMYILKGELFKKFLSVHTLDTVDIKITVNVADGKRQASHITISTVDENNKLETTFPLTIEEMITNKITDYSSILTKCTPTQGMIKFTLSNYQIQEIKRLIKKLHNTNAENIPFLRFNIDTTNKSIGISDSVFSLILDIDTKLQDSVIFPENDFSFNILKSDFVNIGNQTFTIYTSEQDERVIFGASYANSIIWCLSSKAQENDEMSLNDSMVDDAIDDLDFEDDEMFANL